MVTQSICILVLYLNLERNIQIIQCFCHYKVNIKQLYTG